MKDFSALWISRYLPHALANSAAVASGFIIPLSTSVFFNANAADSTSLPTIMDVRDATVGPLSGTFAVSGWMILI